MRCLLEVISTGSKHIKAIVLNEITQDTWKKFFLEIIKDVLHADVHHAI
jgi:hypothetical protein